MAVNAAAGSNRHTFGKRRHIDANDGIMGELCRSTAAVSAHIDHFASHCEQDILYIMYNIFWPANHKCQRSAFSSRLAAGYGSIKEDGAF
ncbi:hypothetical protein D3C84_1128890 [compost metagenome]